MTTSGSVAFVTVTEPNGILEDRVLLLAESLRRWGGRLAECRSCAYRRGSDCRSGASPWPGSASWGSPTSTGTGTTDSPGTDSSTSRWRCSRREATDAESLVWLDADTLVLDEPDFFLESDSDFAAIFTGGDMATTGPSHPLDGYWRATCGRLGLDVEGLPWVEADGRRVR